MKANSTYRQVHIKDGRDSPVMQVRLFFENGLADPHLFTYGRVARVAYMLQSLVKTQVLGVHDHKGWLTIVWGCEPTLAEIDTVGRIWGSELECTNSHIYWHSHDEKYRPVKIRHQDIYEPDMGVIAELGLERAGL